jgi:glutaredoxin
MAFYDPAAPGAPSVFVFGLSTCVHCKAAKKLLEDLGVAFGQVEVDLLSDERLQAGLSELSKYNPAQTFPTLVIGNKVIVGNRVEDIRQAVGRLRGAP